MASFSSRGPAPNQSPWSDQANWARPDWNLIKPDISAPGVSVRSAAPGGGYQGMNGTSMASPHVTGAVAVCLQKNPVVDYATLYNILLDNADHPSQGTPYPNNDYGWGRLNVYAALNATPTVNQPWISVLSRTITDPPPGGNNNGILEPGETGEMVVDIKNVGGEYGYNTTGILESFDNYIIVTNETYLFGDLAPDQTASNSGNPFLPHIHSLTPQGHTAQIGLILHSDGQHDTLDFDDTLFYTLQIGTAPPPLVIYEDDFEYGGGIDSFLNYWEVTGNWHRTTTESHSPTHSAYSGAPLDNAVAVTLRYAVDLSTFSDPQLGFWHMYNFDRGIFMDDCAAQVSTDGGSSWADVWSYNWLSGDVLPWTEETRAIPASSNVKIRFLIDCYTFFQDYADWYVDDFKIFVPADNAPPYFTNTTDWPDTNFTGPFPVQSTVTDESGVDIVYLYFRVNGGSWQQLTMNPQGNDVYSAAIPQQSINDVIDYYLWARDLWITPNTGADPVGAPSDGHYSFRIGTIGIAEQQTHAIRFMPLSSNPTKGFVKLSFAIPEDMNINLAIYDITGRKIHTLINRSLKHGEYVITWDRKDDQGRNVSCGIYFIKFETSIYEKTEKAILLK
jgi:hypothetical protein